VGSDPPPRVTRALVSLSCMCSRCVLEVRACTTLTICTAVEVATRGLSVDLEDPYVRLSARDESVVSQWV